MRRSHRIAAITKQLVNQPHRVFSLGEFAEQFSVAKSTLSEDLALIRESLGTLEMGRVETISGAIGGVRYIPNLSIVEVHRRVSAMCEKLAQPDRILPGGFLYTDDLISSPPVLTSAGEIFASQFQKEDPQYVVTVETAGIPVALMTARALNVPLVIVRRQSRVTEGPVLTMNFLSGSQRLETMSLSRRALVPHSRVLLIDDFMKAGGTLRGLTGLMGEFECEVVGKGVLIETGYPENKVISDHLALIFVEEVDAAGQKVIVRPADWIARGVSLA